MTNEIHIPGQTEWRNLFELPIGELLVSRHCKDQVFIRLCGNYHMFISKQGCGIVYTGNCRGLDYAVAPEGTKVVLQ